MIFAGGGKNPIIPLKGNFNPFHPISIKVIIIFNPNNFLLPTLLYISYLVSTLISLTSTVLGKSIPWYNYLYFNGIIGNSILHFNSQSTSLSLIITDILIFIIYKIK